MLVPSALAIAMLSRLATSVMMMAPVSSSPLTRLKFGLRPLGGSPNVPVMATPRNGGQALSVAPHEVTLSDRKVAGAAALIIGTQPGLSCGGV